MHKFMRTVGFSMYQKSRIWRSFKAPGKRSGDDRPLAEQEGSRLCELRTEVAPGIGVAMIGEMSPKEHSAVNIIFPMSRTRM